MDTENKDAQAQKKQPFLKANVQQPSGVGKFKDMVTVRATSKHPTIAAGQDFKVHSAQVSYLLDRGYIQGN